MAREKSKIKQDILIRVRWLYILFICMGLAIMVKILYTQYGHQGASLRKKANEIVFKRAKVPALRGDVMARDGRVLATTIPLFDVRMDFAADVIDSTMKNTIRNDIRLKARKEKKANEGNRRKIRKIDAATKTQLRDHPTLNKRATELLSMKWDTLAGNLADMFGDRSKQYYKQMLLNAHNNPSKNRYVRINPRLVNFPELKRMMQFPVLNIKRIDTKAKTVLLHHPVRGCTIIEEISRREHPNGSLALRTIGMVRQDSTTQVVDGKKKIVPVSIKIGIEAAFDEYLKGTDGNTLMQSISGIAAIPVPDSENKEPVHGIDVVSTLDIDLQDVAERELRKQLDLQCAEWGCVVLMEVATGEIHAMSNLTRYPDGRIVDDYNYAIGRNMEPGSTFKLATLITLLDDAGMSLDDMIDTQEGRAMIGRAVVVDDHAQHEPISLRRVFEVSSNIGFSKSVFEKYKSDPKRFVDFVCALGLDKPLKVQISGSLAPVIRHPGDGGWTNNLTLPKMAYGYSFEITPMRTLALYNAVANEGKMISPVLVKELKQYGRTVRSFSTQTIVENICTPKTLGFVRESLEKVVEEGTAGVLSNKNYKVAAKTGTAQVAFGNRGYKDQYGARRYIATMVGYFPADKPKYSCIVVMQTYYGRGNYHTYYGASLSGPVFRAVADRVFASQTEWQTSVAENKERLKTPVAIKGGRVKDMKKVASQLSLPLDIEHEAKHWGVVKIDTTNIEVVNAEVQAGVVPQVTGMGLKEAIFLMERQGLRVAFSGRGKVMSQSIPAGTKAVRGQTVIVRLEN